MLKQYLETLLNGFSVPLMILIVSAFRKDLQRRRLDVTTVIGYVAFVGIAKNLAIYLSGLLMHPYDAVFLRADLALGFNPIAFADLVARHRIALIILLAAYVALPLMVGLTWITEQNLRMRRSVLFAGCLCFLFYWLFPAVGPGHFDWLNQVPIPKAPDNCMPSMHLTWALLLALNARSRWLRGVLWGYVGLTVASTLGLREHYLVDLIAALPYTFVIQKLSRMMEVKPLGSLAQQTLAAAKG